MRVGIATVQIPFVRGIAELMAEGLQAAIRAAGHEAEIISLPFTAHPPARICDHMLAARLMQVDASAGQPIDRLIGLNFPAYLMPHPSKRLWLLHQHRSAYDGWEQPSNPLAEAPDGAHVRSAIHAADAALLPECEALYAASRTASERLRRFNGITAEPLYHPPPQAERLVPIEYGDFVLVPGPVGDTRRQHLAIEALALTRQPVRLCFLGAGGDSDYQRGLRTRCTALGLNERVDWRGADADRFDRFGRCLAVLITPVDEDYGYAALEAMLCAKAVLTTADAGGSLEFVVDGHSGLVAEPTAEALADALDRLWADRPGTEALGRAAGQRYRDLQPGWPRVIDCLVS